ncbi:fimbrial protein [Aquabacterium sp. A08]|uniref:AAA family ATPase n=1 Tax=Aquabacterium sp. A08 TaxID=2718532 RepID=UPI001423827D|nr:fimbrial protein [Aquabacterium sp. A08]NIC40971.1 fimbrial protein [Aquabacterium sp. A08]
MTTPQEPGFQPLDGGVASPAQAVNALQPLLVLITDSNETAMRVNGMVAQVAKIHVLPFKVAGGMLAKVAEIAPRAVIVDFTEDTREEAVAVSAQLRFGRPDTPLVALGRSDSGADALAALRSNVSEFLDVRAQSAEVMTVLKHLFTRSGTHSGRGQTIAVFGARAGVGVSTFAANLACCMRSLGGRTAQILLMDLGLPVADSAILLGGKKAFNFVELAKVLDRVDPLFLDSALSKTRDGIATLPLPDNVAELRDITPSIAVGLIDRMRIFFDVQIIDLGGFTNLEFAVMVASQCTRTLLLTEQSATSIVSANAVAGALQSAGVSAKLVVNKYDSALAPTALKISERLDLPLLGTLPERRQVLVQALNQGTPLFQSHPNDAYSRALRKIGWDLSPFDDALERDMSPLSVSSLLEKVLRRKRPLDTPAT